MNALTHAPARYVCPFCELLAGRKTDRSSPDDIVFRDEATAALISARWWPGNEGHVIVVPTTHVENLYSVDDEHLARLSTTVRRLATAIRAAYMCDGTSTRQHNEPGGGQDVWHLHVHVFPRYDGDRLYERHDEHRWADAGERSRYAARLRAALSGS